MSVMASQISSLMIIYSTLYSGADQRTHQSYVSLAFVRGIHRWPLNFPHKGSVTWKMFPFGGIIMRFVYLTAITLNDLCTWSRQILHVALSVECSHYWCQTGMSSCYVIDCFLRKCWYKQKSFPSLNRSRLVVIDKWKGHSMGKDCIHVASSTRVSRAPTWPPGPWNSNSTLSTFTIGLNGSPKIVKFIMYSKILI